VRATFGAAALAVALGGCGPDGLSVQQSGSGDLLTAKQGRALLICPVEAGAFRPCSRATAAVVVPNARTGNEALAYWENDSLVEVMAFGGEEIRCTPSALGGRVRVRLRRVPLERTRGDGFDSDDEAMFEHVPDSCGRG